jgi:hypothetical protein
LSILGQFVSRASVGVLLRPKMRVLGLNARKNLRSPVFYHPTVSSQTTLPESLPLYMWRKCDITMLGQVPDVTNFLSVPEAFLC